MAKEDRPRKSWRELDRSRDGSTGSRPAPTPQRAREEDHAQKQYRAVLEEAFAKGELGKLAEKLMPSRSSQSPAPGAEAVVAEEAQAAPLPPMKKRPDDKLALRKRVIEAIGRPDISKAAEKYLERFPMPDDHEFLEQLLEHDQESRVVDSMARIGAMIDQRLLPKRSRALCSKLRYLAETSTSERTQKDADALLKKLG